MTEVERLKRLIAATRAYHGESGDSGFLISLGDGVMAGRFRGRTWEGATLVAILEQAESWLRQLATAAVEASRADLDDSMARERAVEAAFS